MGWRAGVDSGGTFTDICLYDEGSGRLDIWKTPSTPEDPSQGIVDALIHGLQRVGGDMPDLSYFGHGTTVATNALIELRGARTGLVTTAGFRDLLEIGRQKRPSLYDMMADKPTTLVPRNLRIEVPERLRSDATVECPLDLEAVRNAARALSDKGAEAVAVCFLYSFLNGSHERAAEAAIASEMEGVFISLSSEVAPEFREFERLSTTVVNAFLGPVMKRFLTRLDRRLHDAGIPVTLHLTQSNGGVIGVETAARHPVRTLLSGPSTGVVAAQAIARNAGFGKLIAFDAGGTSTDVALLENGDCKRAAEAEVHGYPIKLPMLDIHTVGAGGGSIAVVDSGGLLKAGPESAGAHPGPACYGKGGAAPTVTDANVVLQTLNPVSILGGRMRIRRDLAVAAITSLAERLGMGLHETAQGIVSVATANMARAIRVISVQRGHDPRDCVLMAYGGAGPLHAARLARELDISRVVVPPAPGALCALGLLLTDLKADFAQSRLMVPAPDTCGEISGIFDSLEAQATQWLDRESIPIGKRMLVRSSDLRYAGQNHELQVPFPAGPVSATSIDELKANFETAHRRRFGFAVEGEAVELATLRVEALGLVEKAELAPPRTRQSTASPKPSEWRNVWMPEAKGLVNCRVFNRSMPSSWARNHRSGNRRADGHNDACSARHGRANRCAPEPDSGVGPVTRIDPITVEVIGSALSSIVEEMGEALVRTSYSTNIKERRDCSTALFDRNGETLCQAEHIPMHLGSFIGVVGHIRDRFKADEFRAGDVFMANDAYVGGGTHLPDIVLAEPVFVDGVHIAWAVNTAHHADFVDRGHDHIYQEGLRIPPVRLYREGKLQGDLLEMFLLNCQVPDERMSDIRAQMSANRLGVRRMHDLCARYGVETVMAAGDALLDYAERKMRAGVASIPDGTYWFSDTFDSNQFFGILPLSVEITVAGTEMTLCFDAPPQVRAGLNMVYTALLASVYYAVKSAVDPTILPNAGLARPLTIAAPEGSILNCRHPAAVDGRVITCQRVADLVFGALAKALPDRVAAAGNGSCTSAVFSGARDDGSIWVYLETIGGGGGARPSADGLSGIHVHLTNTSNLPVEALEPEYPLTLLRYELASGSAGTGKFRGGLGIRRVYRADRECRLTVEGSRLDSRPWGLNGGGEGDGMQIDFGDGRTDFSGTADLRPGQVVSITTAGGGGHGPAALRSAEAVARDVDEDFVSPAVAREVYGQAS